VHGGGYQRRGEGGGDPAALAVEWRLRCSGPRKEVRGGGGVRGVLAASVEKVGKRKGVWRGGATILYQRAEVGDGRRGGTTWQVGVKRERGRESGGVPPDRWTAPDRRAWAAWLGHAVRPVRIGEG
jgi:hypothetical protein